MKIFRFGDKTSEVILRQENFKRLFAERHLPEWSSIQRVTALAKIQE